MNTEIEELKLTIDTKALDLSKRQMKCNEELHRGQIDELMKRQNDMLAKNQDQMKLSYDNIIIRIRAADSISPPLAMGGGPGSVSTRILLRSALGSPPP